MSDSIPPSISTNDLDSLDDLRAQRPNTLLSGVLWSIAGLAVGLAVIFIDYYSDSWNSPVSRSFLSSTAGQFWLFLIVVQTVYWASVARPMFTSLRTLAKYFKREPVAIALWCALFLLLIIAARIFAPSCGHNPVIDPATNTALIDQLTHKIKETGYGLPNSSSKLLAHTIIGAVVALMAGAGSLLLRVGFKTLSPSAESPTKKIKRFLSMRNCLLYFLTVTGVMLSLVTLAQTAKRSAVMWSGCNPTFERGWVLLYGLYYTVIIVIAFAPTFSAMFIAGRKLLDDILPMPPPDDDAWATWYERRQKLQQLLEFNSSQGVRAVMMVVAPLIGSAFSLLTSR